MDPVDIRKQLDEKGIDTKNLAVFLLGGGEQIIGEVLVSKVPTDPYSHLGLGLVGGPVMIKNPKRILRVQERGQNGVVAFGYLMGDLDLVDAGTIEVQAVAAYFVLNLSPESQISLFKLYLDYLQQRAQVRAREAGLVLPQSGLIQPK